jgi:hypothetical protein
MPALGSNDNGVLDGNRRAAPDNGDTEHDFLSGVDRDSIVWRRCTEVGLKALVQYDPRTLRSGRAAAKGAAVEGGLMQADMQQVQQMVDRHEMVDDTMVFFPYVRFLSIRACYTPLIHSPEHFHFCIEMLYLF